MMLCLKSTIATLLISLITVTMAVKFPANPTSEEMSADEKNFIKENKTDLSDESGHEVENYPEEVRERKYLDDALKTVLDPNTIISTFDTSAMVTRTKDDVEHFKTQLEKIERENKTLEEFMDEMDNLSLEVCKTSQQARWSYATDITDEEKEDKMVTIAAEEDEIKKQYWNILKKKYLNNQQILFDPKMRRKVRIIKERGTNVQMPRSKQRQEIVTMQRLWRGVTVCAYNSSCDSEDNLRTLSDIITIFKTSNDTEELAYYWKDYRDSTGGRIRPVFEDYVIRMNNVAQSENFTDAGDMWRYSFEDENFVEEVDRIWNEIKPLYNLLHEYVRNKLLEFYKDKLKSVKDDMIPAHLLGNLWAQDWQAIYPKVAAYPDFIRPKLAENETVRSTDLFDAVDEFYQSLGFESAKETYQDINDNTTTANCLPSSHDMCDGINYKIVWCGERISDVAAGLSRAARLLGHIQYFKHYSHLPPLYRGGPNPAFHDAISDVAAIQMITPEHLKALNLVNISTGHQATINHLLWVALEKIHLMSYAYVLDKWRWDIFGNSSLDNWNQHWWDLRMEETKVYPPVPRNEHDLDPDPKYYAVSHVQCITHLISHVLEFQILLSLCKMANHTGHLHECSIYGNKEAGKRLSDGMSLGASEDWRTVLETITGERELSTKGILEYFSPLSAYLKVENFKAMKRKEINQKTPFILSGVVVLIIISIVVIYCFKKRGMRMLSVCGLRKNGSLDIATNEFHQEKPSEVEGIREDKV